MKKKLVSIVLNNFSNDSRVLRENVTWGKLGYDVTVVALHDDPLPMEEKISGIKVRRIKLVTRQLLKHRIIQVIKYLEFILRAAFGFYDASIFHCNNLDSLPIGVFVKLFLKPSVKIVYDAHEFETETLDLSKIEKLIYRMLERILIRFADVVLTVSDSIASEYAKMYSIDKPLLVLNCPSFVEVAKHNLFRENLDIGCDQKIFLYQGSLSSGRGLDILLESFISLNSDEYVIVFMGYGHLTEKIIEASHKHRNVYFHEAVKPEELLEYTSSADFGVSFIEDACLSYRYCLPNKLFEYLMAGVPVITSNLPEMKKFVEKYHVGLVSKENTAQGLLEAVISGNKVDYHELVSNVNRIKKNYCWEEQEKVFEVVAKQFNA